MNGRRESWFTTEGDIVTVYETETGEARWHVRSAGNYKIVGQGEGHPRFADAVTAAERHHPRVVVES